MPHLPIAERSYRITIVIARALGHVHAALGLATRLKNLGNPVDFAGPKEVEATIVRAGFKFTHLRTLDIVRMPFGIARRPAELVASGSFWHALQIVRDGRREVSAYRASFAMMREEFIDLVEGEHGRIFLFDPFYLLHAIPLIAAGRQVVALSTKPLATYDPLVPPYTTCLGPGMFGFPLRNRLLWMAHWLRYRVWELSEKVLVGATYRELVEEYSVYCGGPRNLLNPRPILFDTRFRGCREWVLHSKSFDFHRLHDVSDSATYVGPCVYHTRTEPEESVPAGNGPVILIAFSTVRYRSRLKLRRRLINLFLTVAELRPDWRMVLAVGEQAAEIAPSSLSRNLLVTEFASSIRMLSQAKVLVCQAGANFIKEAIWHAVPMLLLPDRADQPGNSARVLHHRLGLCRQTVPSAHQICADMEYLLTDRAIADNVRRMSEAFKREDADKDGLQMALDCAANERSSIASLSY